jgi:hypothetical protein
LQDYYRKAKLPGLIRRVEQDPGRQNSTVRKPRALV